ncbi:hypothetical protein [Nocardioides aequoreus]|uniref:hypothetical protein n=1 Tax=Nocardioides aequoreus TaxID=397278 RepID=UPI0012F68C8D|nr:hypothetical protein [Nocardioides aequoreus]
MSTPPRRLLTDLALRLLLLGLVAGVGLGAWMVARHERTFAPEAVGVAAALVTAALAGPGLVRRRVSPGASPGGPRRRPGRRHG